MADIYETEFAYDAACKEKCMSTHQMIRDVLAVDREENLLEKKQSMILYLAGNNRLVSDERLTDYDAERLSLSLSRNNYVAILDLRYNLITDAGVKHIAELLMQNCFLQSLNLMCNDFGEEGAKHLAEALIQKNSTLKILRLNGNKIGNRGGLYFAEVLQVNTALESLDLADTDLQTESLIALATVLVYNQALKALNVSRPLLFSHQEETTDHFARMLKTNQTLHELHLMKQDLRDFGATRLAENLHHNFTLTYLNISCNRITQDGAKQLAEMLKCNSALETLDLGYNRIGDDGASAIADALMLRNGTLKALCIVSNEISGRGLCDIADSLRKKNQSVKQLFVWGNDLQESCCIAFKNLLDTGRLLPDNVDYRPYVVNDTVQLAQVTNGLRCWYYWAPSYGDNAQPEVARFTEIAKAKRQ